MILDIHTVSFHLARTVVELGWVGHIGGTLTVLERGMRMTRWRAPSSPPNLILVLRIAIFNIIIRLSHKNFRGHVFLYEQL